MATEVTGSLIQRHDKELRVRTSGSKRPAIGERLILLRLFEARPGDANPLGVLGGLLGGSMSGWIEIAEVTVKTIEGEVITLALDAERSVMIVNGRKTNHFTPGAKVKLVASPDSPKP